MKIRNGVIAVILVMLILMSIAPVINAATAHLRLYPIGGYYVEDSTDEWLRQSWVTSETPFDLVIENIDKDISVCRLYLIVAVDSLDTTVTITAIDGVELTSPIVIDDFPSPTAPGNKALVETPDGDFIYAFPAHGIYDSAEVPTFWAVQEVVPFPGIAPESSSILTIEVSNSDTSLDRFRVHIDALGTDCGDPPNALVFNPFSEDSTVDIPEFTTIAVPVVAIIGLFLFFNYRKRR
jgi:hypothetical protein